MLKRLIAFNLIVLSIVSLRAEQGKGCGCGVRPTVKPSTVVKPTGVTKPAIPTRQPTKGKVIPLDNEANFDEWVLKNDGPVLVKIYAEWCGPCKTLSPIVHKIAKDYKDLTIIEINMDNFRSLCDRYKILSIPTLLFFNKGKKIDTVKGSLSEAELRKKIASNFGL